MNPMALRIQVCDLTLEFLDSNLGSILLWFLAPPGHASDENFDLLMLLQEILDNCVFDLVRNLIWVRAIIREIDLSKVHNF